MRVFIIIWLISFYDLLEKHWNAVGTFQSNPVISFLFVCGFSLALLNDIKQLFRK